MVAHPGGRRRAVHGCWWVQLQGIAITRKLAANPGKIVALEMGGQQPDSW